MLSKNTNFRNRYFLIIDFIIFLLTPSIALFLRLDNFYFFSKYFISLLIISLVFTLVKLLVCTYMGMYKRIWKHAGIDELALIILTVFIIGIINSIVFILLRFSPDLPSIPRSLPYIDTLVTIVLLGATRMSVRLSIFAIGKTKKTDYLRTLIIGAGQAGVSLVADMQKSHNIRYKPIAFIDDDPAKLGLRVRGINIVGNRTEIKSIIKQYDIDQIIIALPSVSGEAIRSIINECRDYEVKIKTLPSLAEIIDGDVKAQSIREININDLLRRNPVETDYEKITTYIKGKRVLVTGAGGSIGSELCRQIFRYDPSEILLLGHGENSIFNIQQELINISKTHDRVNIKILDYIADIRDYERLEKIFQANQPEIVFHAAAHKHVPLMESNPIESITNNVYGTNNMLNCSEKYGVEKFIMISTDKAVNPTSIMGVTKRIAETLVIKRASEYNHSYLCVRFGNVLGSSGSVVPTFKKQIFQGGPVTVTHPEVKRFFLTIPEAVQLVLHAASIGKGGEIFVLNMGKPIKIVDLAKDIIRLYGFSENEIEIKYTGLRPGEKLFEELFIPGEDYKSTSHEDIFIASNASQLVPDTVDKLFDTFKNNINNQDIDSIRKILQKVIKEYAPMEIKES